MTTEQLKAARLSLIKHMEAIEHAKRGKQNINNLIVAETAQVILQGLINAATAAIEVAFKEGQDIQ